MLILKSLVNQRSVDSAPYGSYLNLQADIHLHCASGFCTQILAYMLDSLVRVSRRVDENHFVSITKPATEWPAPVPSCRTDRALLSHALDLAGHGTRKSGLHSSVRTKALLWVYKAHISEPSSSKHSTAILTDADPLRVTVDPNFRTARQPITEYHAPPRLKLNITQSMTGFQPFPVNNFKYFLTLFSKFFSSFPHGTCSLSVSHRYLALDELYHPFSAALPSNTTLWTHIVRG